MPSTPDDYARGFLEALGSVGVPASEVDEILHGTTVATNALVERKGSRCGMITTRGFRDVLELRRGTRRSPYGSEPRFDPLVPRELRFEIDERTTPEGVERVVDGNAIRELAIALREKKVEAIVVGLLHSTTDGSNEQRVREGVKAILPEVPIVCSSSVCDVSSEFERFSTAAASTYVTPMIERYLRSLNRELKTVGCGDRLRIVTSDGGSVVPDDAVSDAARTAVSGPAAGVSGAHHLCALAGYTSFVTCDMGGTSFDACLVADGVPSLTRERTLGFGLPIAVEMLDITTIGAGGGSIVRPNDTGGVDVGPDGLGADPGPACYGKQTHRAAVTDANIVLGRLENRLRLPEGERHLDEDAARRVVVERVAAPLDLDAAEAAWLIVDTIDEMMACELRTLSLEKRCPLDEAILVAYGGAGPLHAAGIATDLGIPTVLVPPRAGLFSAWGGLLAERREIRSAQVSIPVTEACLVDLHTLIGEQTASVREALGVDEADIVVEIDVAYRSQATGVTLHPPSGFDESTLKSMFAGRAGLPGLEAIPLEVRGARTAAIQANSRQVDALLPVVPGGSGEPIEDRCVRFGKEAIVCPVYDRGSLPIEKTLRGLAVIEEDGATTLVPPGASFRTDEHGLLLVEVGKSR